MYSFKVILMCIQLYVSLTRMFFQDHQVIFFQKEKSHYRMKRARTELGMETLKVALSF